MEERYISFLAFTYHKLMSVFSYILGKRIHKNWNIKATYEERNICQNILLRWNGSKI